MTSFFGLVELPRQAIYFCKQSTQDYFYTQISLYDHSISYIDSALLYEPFSDYAIRPITNVCNYEKCKKIVYLINSNISYANYSLLSCPKKKCVFGRPFFPSQSELFESFFNCSDWLDNRRPSKKATSCCTCKQAISGLEISLLVQYYHFRRY